ncbi:MAG: outer membrane protein assembly factor BamB family protein [Vulcanimicrobiaceae bacterium]
MRVLSLAFAIALLSIAALRGPALVETDRFDWPTYGLNYENTRHADIDGINASNLARLVPRWRFVLGSHERVETTPIVVGRNMYVTTGLNSNVIALDAATGKQKWRYSPMLGSTSACCGAINRGVAVASGRVFFATLDAHLIALDAATGKPLWNVRVGDPVDGFSETMAPLAWSGMVFIGSSGSDYGIRGSLTAYRATDGKRLWRWYAVSPAWEGSYATHVHGVSLHRDIAREKRDAVKYRNAWTKGGGAVWMTPALDPGKGTLYVSTANPAPVFDGSIRPGDNLYTDSIVALDAHTGKMLWYYQQTPHDVWEYEAASPPVLFNARDAGGRLIPAVGEAGKTGWLYILDRRDGRLLRLSQPLTPNEGLYGNPKDRDALGSLFPIRGIVGPIAYDPARHLAFVTALDHSTADFIAAVDVDTGKIVWKKMLSRPYAGVFGGVAAGSLSTKGLVFVSNPEGYFSALDAATGAILWQHRLGVNEHVDLSASPLQRFAHRMRDLLLPIKRKLLHQELPTEASASVNVSPIAYEIDGREYVAIGFDAEPERAIGGAALYTFALSDH